MKTKFFSPSNVPFWITILALTEKLHSDLALVCGTTSANLITACKSLYHYQMTAMEHFIPKYLYPFSSNVSWQIKILYSSTTSVVLTLGCRFLLFSEDLNIPASYSIHYFWGNFSCTCKSVAPKNYCIPCKALFCWSDVVPLVLSTMTIFPSGTWKI